MTDEREALLRTDVRELEDSIRAAVLALEFWRLSRELVQKNLRAAVRVHPRNSLAPALGLAPLMLQSVETAGVDEASVGYLLRAIDRKRALDGMSGGSDTK